MARQPKQSLERAWRATVLDRLAVPGWAPMHGPKVLALTTDTHLAAVLLHHHGTQPRDEQLFQICTGVVSRTLCDFEQVPFTVRASLRFPNVFEASRWHWFADLHQLAPDLDPWLGWPEGLSSEEEERKGAALRGLVELTSIPAALAHMSDAALYELYRPVADHNPEANYPRFRRGLCLAATLGDEDTKRRMVAAMLAAIDASSRLDPSVVQADLERLA